jgi:cell division transport system permease protein
MKLVGATKETIRTPFILQGILQGFSGSLIAAIILEIFLSYFYATYTNTDFSFSLIDTTFILLLLLFGILLGAFGSFISVRKFLKFY